MAKDEYDIVPHDEIIDLKREIDTLKKNPQKADSDESLQGSISQLTVTINKMMEMFEEALGSVKEEETEKDVMAEQMNPINDKLNKILDQQQKLAEGIVALADMIDEIKEIKESVVERMTSSEGEEKELRKEVSLGKSVSYPEPQPVFIRPTPIDTEIHTLPLTRPGRRPSPAPIPPPRFT